VDDLEDLGRELFSGKNGQALRALAQSGEARRLGERLDRTAAEEALRSGDACKMRALLESILSDRDGRTLAQALSDLDGKP
jgi:hypothetical protein